MLFRFYEEQRNDEGRRDETKRRCRDDDERLGPIFARDREPQYLDWSRKE